MFATFSSGKTPVICMAQSDIHYMNNQVNIFQGFPVADLV